MADALSWLVSTVMNLVQLIVLVYIIMGWLYQFDAIPRQNVALLSLYDSLRALSEAMLRPIRRHLPRVGGVDLSALVILLAAEFIKQLFGDRGLFPSQ